MAIEKAVLQGNSIEASGVVKVVAKGAILPKELRARLATKDGQFIDLGKIAIGDQGQWSLKAPAPITVSARLQVTAHGEHGGATATAAVTIMEPQESALTATN